MSRTTALRRLAQRGGAALAATAVAAVGAVAIAQPAQAAPQNVTDATLRWGLSKESGGGAFEPGACNFLSAGAAGNAGSSRHWTEADGFWKNTDGNVKIVKPTAGGGETLPTWSTKCTDADGKNVTTAAASTSGNEVVIANGTGTVDTAAGTASIQWDGAFTIVYYSGRTYWTVSNPVLTINANGSGVLRGTGSGYGADMSGTSWEPLTPTQIDLATFKSGAFAITETGVTAQPDYLGVEVNGVEPEQNRSGANWGAFPQSYVDFQARTGQSSYWYSTGGAADGKKPAIPATFGWTLTGGGTDPGTNPGTTQPGDVDIEVTVPEGGGTDPGPGTGELSLTIEGSGPTNLGTASSTSSGFVASGNLRPVRVDDSRSAPAAWSVNGQATAFSAGANSFGAQHLGWTPALAANTANAVAGAAVAPSTTAGEGLATSRTLVSAAGNATAGSVTVDTALTLQAPANTPAGAYGSKLTLTLVG